MVKTGAPIEFWINRQLQGTTVTVVLVGKDTYESKWVRYEIKQSLDKGNGLFFIDISQIKDEQGKTTKSCGKILFFFRLINIFIQCNRTKKYGEIPDGYSFYDWVEEDGYNNMGDWIEKAAKEAKK
ncbi:MAG: TIR domain-containing protein [Nitrospirae bacterium]|nr:TIR domain-containing protein [Nitrospirota bacterium]